MSNQMVQTAEPQPELPVQVEIPQDDATKVQIDGEDARVADALNDGGQQQDDDPQQQRQPRKPRPRPDKRIATLSAEKEAAVNHAAELQRQLTAERAKAAELERGKSQAEAGTFNAIEAQKKAELDQAKQAYIQARAANNPVAEADAQELIASARAALNDVEAWKATRPAEPEQRQPPQAQPQPQQQRVQPPPPPDATTLGYLRENRWFLPYDYDDSGNAVVDRASGKLAANPDYDPEMHDEAILLHKKLEREYKAGRFEHPPGTPGYFDTIADHMRDQFPDYFGDEQPQQTASRTPQMQQSRQPVAPATRSGMPGQNNGTKRGDKPTLSREQAEFALSLRDAKSPGYVYPRGHAKQGQALSDQDALYKHWQEVEKDKPNTVTR